jgi:AraC-like DNA-binding protein
MTGHSLRELKEQRKLERAKELLRVSAMTVKQIALSSGFNDDNYFCRYFRRKVGSSPMTFRRKRGVLTSP